MIFLILNKIIKNKKGGVQFIESAIIFPSLILFLSFLFIISIKTFSTSLMIEKSYVESRNLLYKTSNEFGIINKIKKEEVKKTNFKLKNISKSFIKEDINLDVSENLFYNSIQVKKNGKNLLGTKKIYQSDMSRKLDFIKEILSDMKDVKFGKYTLREVFDSTKGLADNIKNKMKK